MTNNPSGAGYYSGAGAPGGDEWSVSITDDDQRTMSSGQVVQEYQRGTLDLDDTFVWREGMGDWIPLGQCAELMAFVGQVASQPAGSYPAQVPYASQPGYGAPPSFEGNGATTEALGETVMMGADPAASDPYAAAGGGGLDSAEAIEKRLGERGEASSLFSLDDIRKATAPRGPKAKKTDPAVEKEFDSLIGLGGGLGGGLDGALAATPDLMRAPPPPPPPPPEPPPEVQAQLMAAAQLHVEPPRKSRTGLIIAGFLGVALFTGLTVYFLARTPGEQATAAVDTAAVDDKSGSDPDGDEDKSGDDDKTDDDKSDDDKSDDDKSDDDKSDDDKTDSDKKTTASKLVSSSKDDKKADDKKADDKKADDSKTDDKKADDSKTDDSKSDEPKGEFSRSAARGALSSAAGAASGCKRPGGPTGRGRVSVTFAPSGRATTATVGPPFAGTKVGSCAAAAFRRASVPPFSGGPVTVSKSFTIR